MGTIAKHLQIYFLIILFCACSPAAKLRRAEKLIKQAEALGAEWRTDTVFIDKPVIVPEIHTDSIVVVKFGDTVRIEKERLKVKFVKLKGDTVFLEAECLSDTIYQRVPVTVTKTISARGWLRWWHLALCVGIGFIIALIWKR